MNEDFYSADEGREETPQNGSSDSASSVEYGPSDFYTAGKASKKKRKTGALAIIIAACVAFSLLFGVGGIAIGKQLITKMTEKNDGSSAGGESGGAPSTGGGGNTIEMNETDASAATLTEGTVTAVVSKSAETVVEIITTAYTYGSSETVSGAGSGVIIGSDAVNGTAYIVTNNHVIEGNYNEILVRTSSGVQYTAEIVATDWQSDIAVLRIKSTGLKTATWANSDSLLQGQDVVVIGNPLGSLGGSVSRGVLSGVERTITIEGVPMKLLQIDAAVNPGNSGGGLFDMNGNLIGIVNAKTVGTNIEGIGYAIPSNYAKQMVSELTEKGYVTGRVDLGLLFRDSTTTGGLVISSYAYNEESTTEILSGDVLVDIEIDGTKTKISSLSDYRGVLAKLTAGASVKASIVRVKQLSLTQYYTVNYTVTLTAREITS